ncbi:MAG TPA: serine hydrolase [Vicinamibacterales bacterium]|nr:serine hydrolase [Vicinamibacterales bacterium]
MRVMMVVVALLAGVLAHAQEPGSSSRPTATGPLQGDLKERFVRALLVGGSGVLQYLGTPSLSLRDQATLMIAVSDNSSTNIVIRAVGMERVNAGMAALGPSDIRLRRLLMERVIGQMAAESYGYFDRLASGGAYGRK